MADNNSLLAELEKINQLIDYLKRFQKGTSLIKTAKPLNERKREIEAQLLGSGAIAQDGSIAIGEKGVLINGVNQGDVVTGKKLVSTQVANNITINHYYGHYLSANKDKGLTKRQFHKLLGAYLQWVKQAYNHARLYGVEISNFRQPTHALSEVYVPLFFRLYSQLHRNEIDELLNEYKGDPLANQKAYVKAMHRQRSYGKKVHISKLLTLKDRLVIVGGAGSGKSTLLSHLAISLANSMLSDIPSSLTLPANRKQLLPLIIPLRNYPKYQIVSRKNHFKDEGDPRSGTFVGYISWYLKHRNPSLKFNTEFFDRILKAGGCLLMFDGLDEVVDLDIKRRLKDDIETLSREIYPDNVFLVTVRESGYSGEVLFSDEFDRLDIQPLDEIQIEEFVKNWCKRLYPEKQEEEKRSLMQAISGINLRYMERGLPPIINSPFLANMVVSIKFSENELPRERAKLYESAVKSILQASYLEAEGRDELVNWGGSWEEQRDWLSIIALEMQKGGESRAVLLEEEVIAILKEQLVPQDSIYRFISVVKLRGGLFEETMGLFQFSHLSYQEFLAARWLAKQRHNSFELLKDQILNPWWREVFLLLYGYAKMDWSKFSEEYLVWLSNIEDTHNHKLAGLELAGAALREIEQSGTDLRYSLSEKLVENLEIRELEVNPLLSTKIGNTLDALTDIRFDPDNYFLPKSYQGKNEPFYGFVSVSGEVRHDNYNKYEAGGGKEVLDTISNFYMMRYPTTIAQFRSFIDKSGYLPKDKDSLQGVTNHPVAWVAWDDAIKYCKWLEKKIIILGKDLLLKQNLSDEENKFWSGLVEKKLRVTLPSHLEWKLAAQGTDNRIYPWGNDDFLYSNTEITGLGKTCTVGCFPNGASPFGLLDMSGNVWEWTRSKVTERTSLPKFENKERENQYILCGGSFMDTPNNCRCDSKLQYSSSERFSFVGFRIAIVESNNI